MDTIQEQKRIRHKEAILFANSERRIAFTTAFNWENALIARCIEAINNDDVSINELAEWTGYSRAWLQIIMHEEERQRLEG